jgi:hypothetical protein
VVDNIYYAYKGIQPVYSAGDYIDTITGTTTSNYPKAGYQDGYWYEKTGIHYWNKYESSISSYRYNLYTYSTETVGLSNIDKYQLTNEGITIFNFETLTKKAEGVKQYLADSQHVYFMTINFDDIA